MNIYTHYSDSHKILYEQFFKPSLRTIYTKEEAPIRCLYHEQFTHSGSFMEDGWNNAMQCKLNVIRAGIEECWGTSLIFADVDIQFFKPFISDVQEQLSDCDIVTQEDQGTLCAGFFACKCNDKIRELFKRVDDTYKSMVNDQVALNYFKGMVSYKLLSKSKYFTIGNYFNNKDGTHVWDNITDIQVPNDILIHHGNYVVGTQNKINLMERVRDDIRRRNGNILS